MSEEKVYMTPHQVSPTKPIEFDPKVCDGCADLPEGPLCAVVCIMDVLFPNPDKTKPPLLLYPDECGGCHCGCCIGVCPLGEEGAIKLNWPIQERMRWKDKATGEHFRYGMPNPPPPNTRPPVSGYGWMGKYEKPEK